MPSELDPLLPNNEPAPEISGYGYSKSSRGRFETAEDPEYAESVEESGASQFKSIIALFTVVVGFALLIALLVPGGLGWARDPPKNESLAVRARVDRILTETPLIGPLLPYDTGYNSLAEILSNTVIRWTQRSGYHDSLSVPQSNL